MTAAPSIDVDFGDRSVTADRSELGVVSAARAYLAAARGHLQDLHASGALGHRVNETHSNLIDRLVRRLFRLAEEGYFSDGHEDPAVLSVVAVGGYGRRELNIHSDVDLLFLYQLPLSEHVKAVAERTWSDFQKSMAALLDGRFDVDALLRRRGRPVSVTRLPKRMPGSATITNDDSDFYTIADITADDRLGLLHDLTRVIAEHGFQIYISKAATTLDQVTDTFYLKDRNGKKITDTDELESLRADLCGVVQRGADGDSC